MKNKEKIKIAVCFFGHLRSYKMCAPFLHLNLLKYYDYDLFMHTWSTIDHNTQTWHNIKKDENRITSQQDIIFTYGQFKAIKIEEQKPRDLGNIRIKVKGSAQENQISIFGIDAVFHSMRQSLFQCEKYSNNNNIKYDYILFIRPDIWLKTPLKIQNILKKISNKEIEEGFFTLANPLCNLTSGLKDMSCHDLCFFATPKTISEVIKNTTLIIKDFTAGMLIDHCHEYNFIKLVRACGFKAYRIEKFTPPEDWDILRTTKAIKLRKRIIQIRIRENIFLIWLFPKMSCCIIHLQFDLLGVFKINFALGNTGLDINNI